MKTNLPKSSIVMLVIALVLSVWLSNKLAHLRQEQTVQARTKSTRAGFGKFLSHVGWMRLIQLRGSSETLSDDDVKRMQRMYDSLTDLDPMFSKAYEEGAMDIQFFNAEEALRLLDKAMQVDRLKDWRIPYTAGYIAKLRLKDSSRALPYFEAAAKLPGHPSYVDRSVLYARAELAGNEPMTVLNLWVDYYAGGPGMLFREDEPPSSLGAMEAGGRFGVAGHAGPPEEEKPRVAAKIRGLSASIVNDARKKLESETDATQKKALQQRVDLAQKIVKRLAGGGHLCPMCFKPYTAGERFCSADGTALDVFGVCAKDGTVLRGAFCHVCGAKGK